MPLRIYNTLTRRTEAFQPIDPGRVRLYVCGPTVYAPAHIGHGMSAVVFDVIRRFLEYRGYQVQHVMNYTDVEDKIIRRAVELGIPADELARRHQRELNFGASAARSQFLAQRPLAMVVTPLVLRFGPMVKLLFSMPALAYESSVLLWKRNSAPRRST